MEQQKECNHEWYKEKGLHYYRNRFKRLKELKENGGLLTDYDFKSERFLKDKEAEELAKAYMNTNDPLKELSLNRVKKIIEYAYGHGNVAGFGEGFDAGVTSVKDNLKKWIKEQ